MNIMIRILTGSCCMDGTRSNILSIISLSRATRYKIQLDKIVWAAMLNFCSSSTNKALRAS